jgi:hypothetical protein
MFDALFPFYFLSPVDSPKYSTYMHMLVFVYGGQVALTRRKKQSNVISIELVKYLINEIKGIYHSTMILLYTQPNHTVEGRNPVKSSQFMNLKTFVNTLKHFVYCRDF